MDARARAARRLVGARGGPVSEPAQQIDVPQTADKKHAVAVAISYRQLGHRSEDLKCEGKGSLRVDLLLEDGMGSDVLPRAASGRARNDERAARPRLPVLSSPVRSHGSEG